jgi:3-deoxy-D-manno-octulosonic-acid transferase
MGGRRVGAPTGSRLSVRDRLLVDVGGALGPLVVRALGSTWRVTVLHGDRLAAARGVVGPVVYAFWHGTLLPLEHINRARGICVLSSWHRDGELSARVMTALGYRVVRGSTSRGAARSLQLLVHGVREGHDVAVTPDGPRGPALVVRTGVLYIARRTGAPVVPAGVAASRAVRLGSWDRFMVPLPFSRVVVAYGEPLAVAPDGPLDGDRDALEARLTAATEEADRESRGRRDEGAAKAAPSAAYRAYRLASRALGVLGAPVLCALSARRREWRERSGEMPRVQPGCVWVHAASVGEVAAASPVVAALRERGTQVLLTVVTPTGFEAAAKLAGPGVIVSFAPLDFVRTVRRALDAARPRALLLVETELWPNLIAEAASRGVTVGVVNGRLSARSARRYRSWWSPVRGPAAGLAFAGCRTERDAASFSAIGVRADAVAVTGNTKFETDAAPLSDAEREELRRSLGFPGRGPVVVFGSVRPREERAVAEAAAAVARDHPEARFLVAPRHLARADAVVRRLTSAGLSVARRSDPAAPPSAPRALVLDTTGELGRAYGIAAVAFVGGSLAPYGGHNPLEPAALGVPVVIGPHVESCRDSAEALVAAGAAVIVRSAAELSEAVSRFLGDGDLRNRASEGALAVVASGRGAKERTAALLTRVGVLTGVSGQHGTG